LGQQERFRQGIVWAGRYLSHMERIFKEHNLPIEITRLPFVESSFNLKARSKVGASGIWQFIRSTGKRFLQINRAVDQRNDPIESTIAAAKLLKLNYKSLQSWPLAITAYNHGRAGMMRAVKGVHTRELPAIIAKYKSRTFGFASKNFYASFLAALAVEIDYEKYFGSINIEAPIEYDEVEVEHYIGINTLTKYTNLSKRLVKRYNPALTSYVFREKKYIPRGYKLKLPSGMKGAALQAFSNIPRTLTKRNQRRSIHHRVRRGDTLSYLANRYDTTVRAIRSANQLGKFIYAGQVIVIPK
jgi:membrane-bound lytic murein transglycosylase D